MSLKDIGMPSLFNDLKELKAELERVKKQRDLAIEALNLVNRKPRSAEAIRVALMALDKIKELEQGSTPDPITDPNRVKERLNE